VTLQIPDGYTLTTFHFACTQSTHPCVSSIGLQWAAARTITQHATAAEAVIHSAAGFPCTPAEMSDLWSMTGVSAIGRRAGLLYSASVGSTVVGLETADPPSINTSIKVNKHTGVAGRKYRGVLMFPPFLLAEDTEVDAGGNIDPSRVTGISLLFSNWLSALISNIMSPFLLHSDATAPTPITSMTCANQVGTIRRRIVR